MRDVSETKRYYLSHEASHIGGFFVYLHKILKSNEPKIILFYNSLCLACLHNGAGA